MTRSLFAWLVAWLLLCSAWSAQAEQLQRFGDLEVHWVLVASTWLAADVAATYGIDRDPRRAVLNISPRRVLPDGTSAAVPAAVTGSVRNLLGQSSRLVFEEIREPGAVYYIAPVRFTPEELLRFEIRVVPAHGPDRGQPRTLRFEQQVFPELDPE